MSSVGNVNVALEEIGNCIVLDGCYSVVSQTLCPKSFELLSSSLILISSTFEVAFGIAFGVVFTLTVALK